MNSNAEKLITSTCAGWKAYDRGGPYIEIHYGSSPVPLDVINVYDYAAGKRAEPFTQKGLRQLLQTWVSECADDYHENVVKYSH